MANKKSCQSSNVDLISKLPNELLTHILSFTDTRSAFTTTFLSKRWNRLWISVPNLDFSSARSEGFIDRVLISNNVLSVRTIHFCGWNPTHIARLNAWLASIAKRDAERISLSCLGGSDHMPEYFFDQKRLVHLDIEDFVCCKVPQSVHFPSLRTIRFRSLHLRDNDSLKNLMSGCPVLTDLYVVIVEWDHELIPALDVSSSSLRALSIRIDHDRLRAPRYNVVIDAPNVKNLLLTGHATEIYKISSAFAVDVPSTKNLALAGTATMSYRIRNVPSPTNITLRCIEADNQEFCELLKRFIHSTQLYLAFRSEKPGSLDTLPLFRNLIKLTSVVTKDQHWSGLFRMLHCAPNLVNFVLMDELDAGDVAPEDCIWEEPNEVPRCFVSTLKGVEMTLLSVENVKETMQMISYILKNAFVLKNMYIRIVDANMEQEGEFRKVLSTLPKSSDECQVIYEDYKESEVESLFTCYK